MLSSKAKISLIYSCGEYGFFFTFTARAVYLGDEFLSGYEEHGLEIYDFMFTG